MTPQSARHLGAMHSASDTTVRAALSKRRRKREQLLRALQRIKDEPLRIVAGLTVRRGIKREKRPGNTLSRTTRGSLLLGAAAMSMAAQGMNPTTAFPLFDDPFGGASYGIQSENVRKHASQLRASPELIEAMAEEEGIRYVVYRDVAGYPTVGIGHLVLPEDNLRVGDRISRERAMELHRKDVAMASEAVRDLVGDLPLYQHEFDALVDLVYNVGAGNVSAQGSPRLNAAIDAADYEGIADQLHYHHAGGSKANGLVYRSERRSQIFLDANYEDPREQAGHSGEA